jgi:hypothetical protein
LQQGDQREKGNGDYGERSFHFLSLFAEIRWLRGIIGVSAANATKRSSSTGSRFGKNRETN